ncbi:hypothetical protein FSHL1_003509 [Fusarium sambucinum]
MAESMKTHPAGPPGPGYAVPMVTTLIAIDERDAIYGRQFTEECGFFKYPQQAGTTLWEYTHINPVLATGLDVGS